MISVPISDIGVCYGGKQLSYGQTNNVNNSESSVDSFDNIISNLSGMDLENINDIYKKKGQEMSNDTMSLNDVSNSTVENDYASSDNYNQKSDNEISKLNDDKNVSKANSDKQLNEDSNSKLSEDSKDDISSNKFDETNELGNKVINVENTSDNSLSIEEYTVLEENIMNVLSDDLDISIEELEQIMETLGLTALDLTNSQNVSMLVADINADGDMVALVTNEELGQLALNLNQDIKLSIEEASKDLGISIEELETKINNSLENQPFDEELNKFITDTVDTKVVVSENISLEEFSEKKNLNTDRIEKTDSKLPSYLNESEESYSLNENINLEDDSNETSDSSFSKDGDNNNEFEGFNLNNANQSAYNQINNDNQLAFDNYVNDQLRESFDMVDSQKIISQINEHMKMQLKNGIQELSMQLNPENLGTVHLTLASKESGVTAQLTAQNESVKQALESQIVMLKQNLEQQGVKVEAVEVLVESHEFERNLEQGNDGNRQQEEENEKLRKATRKINLNDLTEDGILDELDDTVMLTAQMMKADGNSMDYKV